MNNRVTNKTLRPVRLIKKFFLSAFVVITFIGYALHKPNNVSQGELSLSDPSTNGAAQPQAPAPTATNPSDTAAAQQSFIPTPTEIIPTAVPPTASAPQNGKYKDGVYTGVEVDAFFGLVQVKATIQNGKLARVDFLEYPNDRRTSVRINQIAMPMLQEEAISAQSANIDLITGATLTSEAFQMSLDSVLSKARGNL